MKFRVTFKTSDALDAAISEALDIESGEDYSEEIDDEQIDPSEIKEICHKWFRYVEVVTLEIDTENLTCVVVEN